MDDGAIIKKVLKSLRAYLQDNLPASKDFISRLYGKNLLDETDADQLVALADKGDKQCIHRLLDYMSSYYVDKTLEYFCIFLEECSKPARPRLRSVAETIRKEMKLQQTTLMQQQHDQQHYQDDIPGPSGPDTPTTLSPDPTSKSVEPPTMSAAVSTDGGDVVYPVIAKLEDDFAELASEVLTVIRSLDKAALDKLCFYLGSLLRPKNPPSSPPPNVPESADKLVDFLKMKWDELNIRVMRSVVGHLKVETVTKQMKDYEQKLSKEIVSFLSECEKREVAYKKDACHSPIAVTIDGTPDEVSLARILQLQDFFVMKLGLGEALFKGFKTGSTILFFSIPEDSVWCLPTCLHPSNLPQLEEWKVVSLSVEGAFTVDIVERRVFDVLDKQSLSKKDHLIGDLKAELSFWKGKVYVLEDILSSHKEVPFEGEKYSSQHPTLVKVKSEPLPKASKPGDVPESEPWTKKPKLEGPDYPDVKTKLETKSEVEATPSETGIKSELETGESTLRLRAHSELETIIMESTLGPGPHPELFEEENLKLTHLYWREQPDVLKWMWRPTAVYLNNKIFVGDRWRWGCSYAQFLYVFNVVSRKWSKVPFHDSCTMYGFTLATTANQVHTLGGAWRKDGKGEEYSKVVFSLDDNMKWSNTLPPLNIGRECATSTSFEDMIVVAGGQGRNCGLSSVEVLDSSQPSSTWWEICDLPEKSCYMQCTVTDNELFIGCGVGTDNTVYTTELSAVKESLIPSDPKYFWQFLPKTPLEWSGLVAVDNCLVTVGGCNDNQPHSSIDFYDCYKKTWTKVSDIRKSRESPAVVVCTFKKKQELFILCGSGANTSVESCEL